MRNKLILFKISVHVESTQLFSEIQLTQMKRVSIASGKSNRQSATKKKEAHVMAHARAKTDAFDQQHWDVSDLTFGVDSKAEPSMIRQDSQPSSLASLALKRWAANNSAMAFEDCQEAYDMHMLRMSKKLSKQYSTNIYKLNKVSQLWEGGVGCTERDQIATG